MVNEKYHGLGTAPSVIRELFAYGLQQAKVVGKENVYDYSLGNPSIPAPAKVNETIKKLVDTEDSIQLHGYSMAPGFENVRQAIADNLNERFGVNAKANELFMTCGCAPALVSVAHALTTSPEDEFVAIAPFFPEYNVFFTCAGAKLTVVPADTVHFQIDMDALEKTINEHSVAVVINSPNNPSGVIYPEANIKAACEVLKAKEAEYGHPIYIIADEPYRELVYTEEKVAFIPSIYDNTIICYSWSKSLSLPGDKIGYIAVPKSVADYDLIIPAINGAGRVLGYVCAPSLFQQVVKECVDVMPDIEPYRVNRDLLYNALVEYGYNVAKPSGAFYMYIEAPDKDAEAFCEKAKQQDVLLVPGTGFGTPSYMRLSYCVEKSKVEKCLPVFKKLMEEYK